MHTVGFYRTYIAWAMVAMTCLVFVMAARGPIHQAAWRDDCTTFQRTGMIATPPELPPGRTLTSLCEGVLP